MTSLSLHLLAYATVVCGHDNSAPNPLNAIKNAQVSGDFSRAREPFLQRDYTVEFSHCATLQFSLRYAYK